MAVRVTKDLICDVCGGDGSVARYRITRTSDTKTVSPDLCREHSAFIEDLFKKLPTGKRGQTRARPVLTEAQVKAKKRSR